MGAVHSINSGHPGCLFSLRILPIAVLRKLSDLPPMKVCWLHGIVLALLVNLSPLTVQAMHSAMVMPEHAVPSNCDYASSPENCCECCADCDKMAAIGACSLFCLNHSGLTGASINFAIPEVGVSLPTWANCWAHRTIPPDLHPPKSAVIV